METNDDDLSSTAGVLLGKDPHTMQDREVNGRNLGTMAGAREVYSVC